MSTQATLPDQDTAFKVIQEQVDKRAFFDCWQSMGCPMPETEKEAEELYAMSFKVAAAETDPVLNKEAAAANPGPYAFANAALDRFLGVKTASANPNPSGLDDVSIAGAYELANNPAIFASALVVKAAQVAQAQQLEATQAG